MTNQLKTSLENSMNTCKWCEKSFRSERTLSAHMCVKKRRFADKELTHVRLGYRVFQMFYELNTTASKSKSAEDFIKSQYYEGFVKFGRACIVNEYLRPEKFAEWLIKEGKKLADWSKDKLYDEYLLVYVKKEPGLKALERSIIYLTKWAEENNDDWTNYFAKVTPARAVHDIRSAKISPWVLYLSSGGGDLLTRFNDEQVKMIEDVIDATFWMKVFAKNKEEVQEVKHTCEVAKL
jgi:hypothetical protein|tara:strand:+ start:380 stop:1087 length:708 start_codon:yes stop_codon:yes gene_type:complete